MKPLSILRSCGFKQYVADYTRITQISKTIIDLIFSNINIVARPITAPRITDYCIVEIAINTEVCMEPRQEIQYRNYAHF